jgi:hypothetical protein
LSRFPPFLLSMDESTKKAFDFAADITKQLITVASAIVTVTVTFSKDTPPEARTWAYAAWFVFIVSILSGFGTLLSLTGQLQPNPKVARPTVSTPTIWKGKIRFFWGAQIILFVIAIGFTAWFGRVAMHIPAQSQPNPPAPIFNCVLPSAPTNSPAQPPQPISPQPKKEQNLQKDTTQP